MRSREYWLDDYGIRDAWATTHGAGVTIAIIDTGIDSGVARTRGAVVGGTDVSGIGVARRAAPGRRGRREARHAGRLARRRPRHRQRLRRHRLGAAGVAALGVGRLRRVRRAPTTQIAEAVRWAVDNGADVINMSLTRNTLDWPESWDDAFLYAFEHDVVVVAAAGNRGSGTIEVGAPATMPGVLTVAGRRPEGTASFDASTQGITIGVAAPSEDLVGVSPAGST